MFEGTIISGLMEQENEIDFDNLKFPIYRKGEQVGEWYRFDSIDTLINIRLDSFRGNVVSVGIIKDLDKLTFVDLYSNREECTDEEFSDLFHKTLAELKGITISSTETDSDK